MNQEVTFKSLGRSLAVIAAAALAVPFAANAQGWYAGAGIGQADYDLVGEEDTSFKLFGGYQLNPNVAVEFGYVDLGEAEISESGVGSASLSADGFGVWLLGMAPVADRLSLFGKVGFFNWDAEAEVTDWFGHDVRRRFGNRPCSDSEPSSRRARTSGCGPSGNATILVISTISTISG